jgi:hypothetical protein
MLYVSFIEDILMYLIFDKIRGRYHRPAFPVEMRHDVGYESLTDMTEDPRQVVYQSISGMLPSTFYELVFILDIGEPHEKSPM